MTQSGIKQVQTGTKTTLGQNLLKDDSGSVSPMGQATSRRYPWERLCTDAGSPPGLGGGWEGPG